VLGGKRKDALFFDGLREQAALNVRTAKMLETMLVRMNPPVEVAAHPYRLPREDDARRACDDETIALATAIDEAEREGDRIKHAAMKRLRESWITPFDREDIRGLVHGMDDVLDRIEAVADRIILFHICVAPPEALELARILIASCDALASAVGGLPSVSSKKATEILERCAEVNRLETKADVVHRRAMAELFVPGNDPLVVMKWRDLYDGLEAATDSCEDVADIAEGVVLEYA